MESSTEALSASKSRSFIEFPLLNVDRLTLRKFKNVLILSLLGVAAAIALTPLVSVVTYVVQLGFPGLNRETLLGFGNAALGSLVVVGVASIVGVPWGIALGIFLSERKTTYLAKSLRTFLDVVSGIPSIIVGLLVYAAVVVPMKGFSGWAGAIALACILIPSVARVTEDSLNRVSRSLKEAGLGLGLTHRRVVFSIVLKSASKGILTGALLSIARISGETAPLLLTSLNSRFWTVDPMGPMATLPVQIYTSALAPSAESHQQAWAAALLLLSLVTLLNGAARIGNRRAGGLN